MSKVKVQRKIATQMIETYIRYVQTELNVGEVKLVSRPMIGKFIEPATNKKGVGFELTPSIKDAIVGIPGTKFVQSKDGHKEVFVEVTGV